MTLESETRSRTVELKPKLAFRVGVTGTRTIPPEALQHLQTQADIVLRKIRDEVLAISRDPRAKDVYQTASRDRDAIEMRLISPLAAGADRLAADVALQLGYRLFSPLPFVQSDYEKDFPDSLDDFHRLLANATIVELDGDLNDPGASYEAVGRYVVRNCDVLIAFWNGAPGRGRGGTADIVKFASLWEMPVWWIGLDDQEPRLIESLRTLRHRTAARTGNAAFEALVSYIRTTLLPPKVARPERHGTIGLLAHLHAGLFEKDVHPVMSYLREPAPKPIRGIWRTYGLFYDRVSPRPKGPPMSNSKAPVPDATFWRAHHLNADGLSTAYANRYRSSYVLIYLIALFAVTFSVLGEGLDEKIKIATELLLISSVVVIAWANHIERWHERWIAYRLLAELCRKQEILAPLGRSLPSTEVDYIDMHDAGSEDGPGTIRGSWVGWFFQALQRGAPWPERDTEGTKRRALDLARSLVAEQRDYHRARSQRAALADRRLAIGDSLLVLSAVLLLICLLGVPTNVARWLEVLAGVFSAASATFVGLRTYSEFSLLARESQRMKTLMLEIGDELESIDIDTPLASVELGSLSHRLSILMMHEIDGWAQLFRLRTVEIA